MNAVQDGVVVSPEPILLVDRSVDGVVFGDRFAKHTMFTVDPLGQTLAEPLVGLRGERESIDRLCAGCFIKVLLTLVKHVDEVDFMEASDASHRLGVTCQVFVFLHSTGEILFGGKVLEGRGRYEVEFGGLASVIGLGEGVLHEGIQFGFEESETVLTVERFVVAEKRDQLVGLEAVQPLVGRFVVSNAVVSLQVGVELICAGEGPLIRPTRAGTETRRIAGETEIAHDDFRIGESVLHGGFEVREINHALG